MSDDIADLVAMATPPPGTSFVRGFWFTHDLDLDVVAHDIAPALTDVALADRAERYRRAAAWPAPAVPSLVLVADRRRFSVGGGLPWCHIVPVGRRVQHAKFGVLEFAGQRGRGVRRAFVTSANLTRSGISSNREVLVVEDLGPRSRAPSLAGDLLAATEAFLTSSGPAEVPVGSARSLREVVAHLRRAGPVAPGGMVEHSLDASRTLLAAGPSADRIDVVSPSFATDRETEVARMLASAGLGRSTTFRWVLDPGADSVPRLPSALWDELGRRCSTSLAVSSDRRRRLHAKVIVIRRGDEAEVYLGSSNLTRRGLGGRNRELVLRVRMSSTDAADLLDRLPSVAFTGETVPTMAQVERVDESPLALPEITAADAGLAERGDVRGRLEVQSAPGTEVVGVEVGGSFVPPADLTDVVLGAGLVRVKVRDLVSDRTQVVLVPVDLGDVRPDLWRAKEERPGRTDRELDELEAILLRVARTRSTRETGAKRSGTATDAADDTYIEGLRQPLVLLARHRHALIRDLSTERRERPSRVWPAIRPPGGIPWWRLQSPGRSSDSLRLARSGDRRCSRRLLMRGGGRSDDCSEGSHPARALPRRRPGPR